MKLLFLDTETTGTDPKVHGVIQISGIIEIDGKEKERFDFRCATFPQDVIHPDALKVNGVTMEQIRAYPAPETAYLQLIKILDKHIDRYDKTDKFSLVGQNVKFDYDMMSEWFKKNGNNFWYAYVDYHLIDLVAATAIFTAAGLIKLPNMKLATVAEYFGIKFEAHNSMADIEATRSIFYKYVDIIKGEEPPKPQVASDELVME